MFESMLVKNCRIYSSQVSVGLIGFYSGCSLFFNHILSVNELKGLFHFVFTYMFVCMYVCLYTYRYRYRCIYIQYCEKVMQTIIVEYRALF